MVAIQLEAIEVILNHILYIRGVYPAQIFKKRRVYNTPVFIVAFPALSSYLANVLKTVQQHLLKNTAQFRMEITIYGNESDHMESYFLEMQRIQADPAEDQYLMEYEQQLRTALYKFADRVKHLPKLDQNAKFKVRIHTTQAAFTELSHDAQYQEFPWLQSNGSPLQLKQQQQKFSLLPLSRVDKVGLRMEAHIHN